MSDRTLSQKCSPLHFFQLPNRGDLPSRAQKLVLEWALLYQQDLLQMWDTQEFRRLPPLK
jgi:Domain of unknown function (DUF4160)